jgi:hypothetical protein
MRAVGDMKEIAGEHTAGSAQEAYPIDECVNKGQLSFVITIEQRT